MGRINPPRLVTVAVFTTITIIFWIFFGVYNILTSEAEVDINQRLLAPIDPTIKTQVLNQIPNKKHFDIFDFQGSAIVRENIQNTDTRTIEVQEETTIILETENQEETFETEEVQSSESISIPSENDLP